MKAIRLNAVIEGIRSKKDRSLGLSISTPELSVQERALFMEMQGINIDLSLIPLESTDAPEEYKIDKELENKTQGQRIRAVLFLLFKQNQEGLPDFETYYRNKTDKYIEFLKKQID